MVAPRTSVWLDPPRASRAPRTRRVGLAGILTDLDRTGSAADGVGAAATHGFALDAEDTRTHRWYPQGIAVDPDGSAVLVISWYAKGRWGWLRRGSRITVVADPADAAPRYRHIILVEPRRVLGTPVLSPVRVHAGGIAWYRGHLFVACTDAGLRVFRLDDLAQIGPWRGRGRYVLPQALHLDRGRGLPGRPLRHSFVSLEAGADADHLVVGEYGRKGSPHRLARYRLDRATGLPVVGADGRVAPSEVHDDQPDRMQGATVVDGTWVLTASTGPGNPGDLYVGAPGAWTRHRRVLPPGPEDVTWWPQRGELWSLSEHPGDRWVWAVPGERWLPPRA